MSIPPPRELQEHNVRKPYKLTGDVEEFFKEHEETIKKYNEKPKAGQDLTILEVKDIREIVELEQKEVIKKQKEVTDNTDLPSDDLVEQVLMEMEQEEGEETVQGEVVESQPMQIEGEEDVEEEDEAARNARELEEGFTVEYLIKNFITTSNEDPKDTVDLKYMNIRLVFDPNYSLYISSDTRLSSKTIKVTEQINGALRDTEQLRVYTNSDYKITEFEGETRQRTDLQEDVEFTRRTRPDDVRCIPTGMSPKVSLFKRVTFGNAKFSLGVTNTIFGKSIAEPDEGDDPLVNYNVSRYLFYRCKDIVDHKKELNEWFHTKRTLLGFNPQITALMEEPKQRVLFKEADLRVMKNIQDAGGNENRKNGEPYTSTEQYLEDFGMDINQFKDVYAEKYKNGELSEDDYKKYIDDVDNYVKHKTLYDSILEHEYEIALERQIVPHYWDVIGNTDDYYEMFNSKKSQMLRLEKALQGEKIKVTKPKFSIQIEVAYGGNIRVDPYKYMPVRITIHGESVEQQRRLQEIFNKNLVAIIVRTSEYAPSPLVEQRKREFAEWKAAKEAEKI